MYKYLISMISLICILGSSNVLAVGEDITEGSSAGKFIKVGGAGAQFLKIGFGARSAGMGGASGASVNDLSSIFWNPAGIAEIKKLAANFSYTSWILGFNHNFGAISMPIGEDFALAASLISFSSDDILETTMDYQDGQGKYYTVSDIAIGLTFAGYLTDQFSFGITAKYVKTGFSTLSSGGVAFDVGTKYETGIQGIKLGFSIHNLGTEHELRGQDLNTTRKLFNELKTAPLDVQYLASPFLPPLIFRAGASGNIIEDDEQKLTAEVDFVTLSDTPEQFIVGAEYVWNFVAVRAGYHIGHDQFGLGLGAGLKYISGGFTGQVDYSFNPTFDLGVVNRLTVSVIFGD